MVSVSSLKFVPENLNTEVGIKRHTKISDFFSLAPVTKKIVG